MAALPAPRRKHLAAARALHARAKTVGLGAPAFARLIGALWQIIPLVLYAPRLEQISSAVELTQRKAGRQRDAFPVGLQALPQPFAN